MNNFQKFRRTLTPELIARWMECSKCPLRKDKCGGFSTLAIEEPLEECYGKLMKWFLEETP